MRYTGITEPLAIQTAQGSLARDPSHSPNQVQSLRRRVRDSFGWAPTYGHPPVQHVGPGSPTALLGPIPSAGRAAAAAAQGCPQRQRPQPAASLRPCFGSPSPGGLGSSPNFPNTKENGLIFLHLQTPPLVAQEPRGLQVPCRTMGTPVQSSFRQSIPSCSTHRHRGCFPQSCTHRPGCLRPPPHEWMQHSLKTPPGKQLQGSARGWTAGRACSGHHRLTPGLGAARGTAARSLTGRTRIPAPSAAALASPKPPRQPLPAGTGPPPTARADTAINRLRFLCKLSSNSHQQIPATTPARAGSAPVPSCPAGAPGGDARGPRGRCLGRGGAAPAGRGRRSPGLRGRRSRSSRRSAEPRPSAAGGGRRGRAGAAAPPR